MHQTTRAYYHFPRFTLEEYVQHADAAAHVLVQSSRVEAAENGSLLTIVTLTSLSTWFGEVGETFDVWIPGGEIEGRSLLVPEAPVLTPGMECVMFLTLPDDHGRRGILCLRQGTYVVERSQGVLGRVSGLHAQGTDLMDFQSAVNQSLARK